MRHPMIASLLGLMGTAVAAVQSGASLAYRLGTSSRRSREGSRVSRPSLEHCPHRQSMKDDDVHLRGYAGAKMDRKAKAKTLGLRHGTSAHMKGGSA